MRLADYVMERLRAAGVRHLFAVTGRGSLFLSDAVARARMPATFTHHEQAAAYAAVAAAQGGDALGACLVSTGCAATNTLSGVLTAWQDGVPCVFLSGQNVLAETARHTGLAVRTFGQQETDLVPLVSPITKYATMLTDPAAIGAVLDEALYRARAGRMGPVWIDIPLDLQSAQVDPGALARWTPPADGPDAPASPPDDADVRAVREALGTARRPVVLIGSGVRAAGAEAALAALVDRCGLPVVYAASAPDSYGSAHALSIGSVGTMGCSRAGAFALQNADFVLVLGCRLTSMTTGPDCAVFARAARVVGVDIDPAEHAKATVRMDHRITADVGAFLSALLDGALAAVPEPWRERCRHWKATFPVVEPDRRTSGGPLDLYELAEALSDALPEGAHLVTDSGFIEVILPPNVRFRPGQRCLHPASQGAMGYALPAAVGTAATHGRPTVAVIGDGSVMMNLQEFQTLRHAGLPVKVLVVNNNAYAIIRRRQVELFRGRTIGTDLANGVSCPDFARVAECFGLPYRRIDASAGLADALRALFAEAGPVLCEVMAREDQGYIEQGHARTAEGRYVRRPLEDQAPFLPREQFLAEMCIPPVAQ